MIEYQTCQKTPWNKCPLVVQHYLEKQNKDMNMFKYYDNEGEKYCCLCGKNVTKDMCKQKEDM